MRRLLRSGVPFSWKQEQKEAFSKMKAKIAEACPLAIFDPSKETIVATSASDRGLGAVLLQKHSVGERPVAYASASLTETQ